MPTKQQTHIRVVRQWCLSLAVLTAVQISRQEAEMKLAAYVPMLMQDYPDAAFTAASLNHVARASVKGFPTYPELCVHLRAWWREHRPYIALPPPPIPKPRPEPTPEELEHVRQLVAEVTSTLRVSELKKAADWQAQLDALNVPPRPRALYLAPEVLDQINPLPNGRKRVDLHATPSAEAVDPDPPHTDDQASAAS